MRHSNRGIWLVAALAALALGALGGIAFAATTKDVKTGSTSLGTVLVNKKGLTLYDLSVEKKNHFICTGSCNSTWHPLRPRKGHSPSGVGHLSVLKRPDGTKQIAYKGHPLYTFSGDSKKGDTNGQGFMDVGTWGVVKVKKSSSTQTQTTNTSTGGGGGYPTYPGY
jgi:predicted lipoprotein with Yx(FWY)xxD motif